MGSNTPTQPFYFFSHVFFLRSQQSHILSSSSMTFVFSSTQNCSLLLARQNMIYQVEDPVFKGYLAGGFSAKVSSKEHSLNNYAAGAFCA